MLKAVKMTVFSDFNNEKTDHVVKIMYQWAYYYYAILLGILDMG